MPKSIIKGLNRDLDQGIINWVRFEGCSIEAFGEWKVKCLGIVTKLLSKVFHQKSYGLNGPVLRRPDVIKYLTSFHSKYVITSIDKTTSNLGIVCKKYYIKNILVECGFFWGGNDTYEIPTQNKQSIVNKLKSGLNCFRVKQSEDHKDGLPFIYSIIKMHKTPIQCCYIISSRLCTTKPLSKAAMLGLKECQQAN